MKYTLFILVSFLILFSSCVVSKQKYDELQLESDTKIKNLNNQIDKLVGDFNLMRNELSTNNSKKDMLIDEVNQKIYGLSSSQEEIKDELETVKDKYKWTSRESNQKDKTILELNKKINRLQKSLEENKSNFENTLSTHNQNTNSLKEKIRLLEKQNKLYTSQIKRLREKINKSVNKRSEIIDTLKNKSDIIK